MGTRLFNKRHHGAKKVVFSPTMNNILVIYGGPNGMTVYSLDDLRFFNEREFFQYQRLKEND